MKSNFSAIILSGGKSRRMGENKALLKVGDKTVIELIYEKLSAIFKEIILVTNDKSKLSFLNVPVYEDEIKELGPVVGVYTGLKKTKYEKNFVISCDLPLISQDSIRYLLEYPTSRDITLYQESGFPQFLCGLYSKNCLGEFEKLIEECRRTENFRKLKFFELIKKCPPEIIGAEKFPFYNPNEFLNMNNREDYVKVIKLKGKI
jgi:molybdopterin-guanine dinucleotide biosynthesis protein A